LRVLSIAEVFGQMLMTVTTTGARTRRETFVAAFVLAFALSACAPSVEDGPPNSQPSEAALLETARSIHQDSLVLDAHADIVVPSTPANFSDAEGISKIAPEKLKAGGVGAVVMSIAAGPGPRTLRGRCRGARGNKRKTRSCFGIGCREY